VRIPRQLDRSVIVIRTHVHRSSNSETGSLDHWSRLTSTDSGGTGHLPLLSRCPTIVNETRLQMA